MIYFYFLFFLVFCCCSFHCNYALVALVIMRIISILELLALFWLWHSGIVCPVGVVVVVISFLVLAFHLHLIIYSA